MTRDPGSPDRFAPRFAELATFLRAPLGRALDETDIGLFGVPYDGALSNRPGARHGPREVRNQSSLVRAIHHVTRINPFELARIRDLGDVPFRSLYDIETTHADIAAFTADLVGAQVFPFAIGGDHSISLPLLRAVAADGPVALIHVDAHTDTWDELLGSKFTHGSPFRRAVEEGLIDPHRTIQIGIRGTQNFPSGWEYSQASGMRVAFCEELHDRGPAALAEEARKLVGDRPVYLSFDIDALDPAYAPGTGTPEIGGLTSYQSQALLRGLRGLNWVGADLVEVSPPFDVGGLTSLTAATLAYEMVCLFAESRRVR